MWLSVGRVLSQMFPSIYQEMEVIFVFLYFFVFFPSIFSPTAHECVSEDQNKSVNSKLTKRDPSIYFKPKTTLLLPIRQFLRQRHLEETKT